LAEAASRPVATVDAPVHSFHQGLTNNKDSANRKNGRWRGKTKKS
jgi:hypothetical protein